MSDTSSSITHTPQVDPEVTSELKEVKVVSTPGGKVKKDKKRKRRSSPYNDFKREMMRSEEIKKIKPRSRFKYISEAWKNQKAKEEEEAVKTKTDKEEEKKEQQ